MVIGLASDHAAYELKQYVKQYLEQKGLEYKDYGTFSKESCNYAEFGHALAEGIERGEVYPGIAMCGSGEGISMNVLVMPGRFINNDTARDIMDEFLNTPFEGGRHKARVASIPIRQRK